MESAAELLTEIRDQVRTVAKALEATNEKLEVTNDKLEATNEKLEATNEKLEATNEKLDKTARDLRAEMRAGFNALYTRIDGTNTRMDHMHAGLGRLTLLQAEMISKEIAGVDRGLEELRLGRMNARLERCERDIDDLKDRL